MLQVANLTFRLGGIDCTVLLDHQAIIGRERFLRRFPQGDESDYARAFAQMGLSLDLAEDNFNILLIRLPDATVLVDSGEGGKPNGGALLASMAQAGISPGEIDLIVITHSHGDHVQGLLDEAQQPLFPQARYIISREEMAFWQARIQAEDSDHGPIVAMMRQQGQRLIDMDEAILPGLWAVPLPGHTPGHIGLRLESQGETLLHMADLLHSPMQLAQPAWSPKYDRDPSLSVLTRRAALQQAADTGCWTLFYHLGFPGLGRVRHAGDGFTWESQNNRR